MSIEIDGLRRDRKIGLLWLIVGTVIGVVDPPPVFFIPCVIAPQA